MRQRRGGVGEAGRVDVEAARGGQAASEELGVRGARGRGEVPGGVEEKRARRGLQERGEGGRREKGGRERCGKGAVGHRVDARGEGEGDARKSGKGEKGWGVAEHGVDYGLENLRQVEIARPGGDCKAWWGLQGLEHVKL